MTTHAHTAVSPVDPLSPVVSLYVHVPFCRARCDYCDFDTVTGVESLIPAYAEALAKELRAAAEIWRSVTVSTVYVGGGTPSLLPLRVVADLVDTLEDALGLGQCEEFSFEANPGTVSTDYLQGLRLLGVDRLSLGVQSAHDAELRRLGRIHRWGDAVRAVESAREAGFENVSLDLLFGVPSQSLKRWKETLNSALELEPDHLSLYGLTIEEGTPLAERIRRGDAANVGDEASAAMFEWAEARLADAGFFHYEISNWARAGTSPLGEDAQWWPENAADDLNTVVSEGITGRVCHHNLTYWRNRPWLGLGAAAHSWVPADLLSGTPSSATERHGGERWANPTDPTRYIDAVLGAEGFPCPPHEVEPIDRRLAMGETMMLGLRLAEGVRAQRFEERFGSPLADVFGGELESLQDLGLVTWDGVVARLTARGRLLGNRVFERFV